MVLICVVSVMCSVMANGAKPPRHGNNTESANVGNSGIASKEKNKPKASEYRGILEGSVLFYIPYKSQTSSTISASYYSYIEMMASILKAYTKSKVKIKGYSSADGSLDFNINLAKARAESVKKMLVNKYGIPSDRIDAWGAGIGDMFSEVSWNWIAICEIENVGDNVDVNEYKYIRFVPFKKGISTISSDYMMVVESLALFLKNHRESKLLIEGFESEAESKDPYIGSALAYERANEIMRCLEDRYGIDGDRIIVRSGGVSKSFPTQPENQVVRCVIEY